MARKRHTEVTASADATNEKNREQTLVLSDPGQVTEKNPKVPGVVNMTPDGRIKRIDY